MVKAQLKKGHLVIILTTFFTKFDHFSPIQSVEVRNAKMGKQTTPPSTFNQSIGPILDDNVVVESSPPKNDEDLEQTLPDHSHDSNAKNVEDDQPQTDEEDQRGPSPVESGEGKATHCSSSDGDEDQTNTDGDGYKNNDEESEDEFEQESPKTNSLTKITQSTSAIISQEEIEALRERDPFEAFDLMLSGNIFPSKTDPEPSTVSASDLSKSSKDHLLEELRTKILEVDLF